MCRILDLPMLAGIIGLSLALWQKHPNFTQRDTFFTHSLLSLPGTWSNPQTLMTRNMETKKPIKAVALISGGLDSTLAALIVKRQGIDVYGLHFVHAFNSTPEHFLVAEAMNPQTKPSAKGSSDLYHPSNTDIETPAYPKALETLIDQLDIPLRAVELTSRIIELVKDPKHGYGKHLNPCIDCRILQFTTAKRYIDEIGADFTVTGEVVGQRPMSQRRQAIELIDRRAGVEGLVLRPLTAKRLEPTVPEQRGWVDRSKLYGISGRSRKGQKRLAQEFGISDYPQAGGGCRLTYEGFSRKMRDLIDHKDPDENDTFLLLAGRHFRTSGTGKAIAGKDENDNERLKKLARDGDMLFEVDDGRGPTVLLRDADSEPDITLAASLCVSHTKLGGRPSKLVRYWLYGSEKTDSIQAAPLESEQIEKMRI